MRVLHFYKTSFPDTVGGVEQVIDQIARGTSLLGVQTDVLSLKSGPDVAASMQSGYRRHIAKRNFQIASTDFSVGVFSRFARLACEADLVHYHYP